MSNLHVGRVLLGAFLTVSLATFAGCVPPSTQKAAEAPAPPPAPKNYEPNFSYKAANTGQKLDVTVGVISPQFTDNVKLYHQNFETNEIVKRTVSSLGATFNEVLVAKGFNTKGPFVSLNDMTFPEKKGSDLLLYPEFDFQVNVTAENKHAAEPEKPAEPPKEEGSSFLGGLIKKDEKKAPAAPKAPPKMVCDVSLSVSGNILFVAQEPLSGERMWIKRLDVSASPQTFPTQEGPMCDGSRDWSTEIKNAWAKAHEIVYQSSMKAFDNYVNGEEFQQLKAQSQELRQKKAY